MAIYLFSRKCWLKANLLTKESANDYIAEVSTIDTILRTQYKKVKRATERPTVASSSWTAKAFAHGETASLGLVTEMAPDTKKSYY